MVPGKGNCIFNDTEVKQKGSSLLVSEAGKTGRDQIMQCVIHVEDLGLNSEGKGVAKRDLQMEVNWTD